MIEGQPTRQETEAILASSIEKDNNGSVTHIDNSATGPDIRKTLFKTLNAIDTFGELRAELILKLLNIKGDIREHINHFRSAYNSPSRYYHSWEHIVEGFTTLFDMACEMEISDEDLAIIGGSILFHDFFYEVNKDWYSRNETMSSQEAFTYLNRFGVDMRRVSDIHDLIIETRHGRSHVSDALMSQVSHDIDMAILGSSESRYRQYARDVRDEFAPIISGEDFERLRLDKFITPVLSNIGGLYKTDYARNRFNENLERNLIAEQDRKIQLHPVDKE